MTSHPRSALITGCSEGSLGEALALSLANHSPDTTIFAALRDTSKASSILTSTPNIQIVTLDVLSDASIKSCVEQVSSATDGTLDMLINNAGGGHYMPFLHLDLNKARDLFEVNVWSYLAVTQAFLPLLMKGKSIASERKSLLVNNTSISSVLKTPYHSAYGASKAAMAAFNDAQRIELRPFGIVVVDLKTGSTESKFSENRTNEEVLPSDSPYMPIEKEVLNVIRGDATEAYAEDREGWARDVIGDLLQTNPPAQIWRGGKAGTIQVSGAVEKILPTELADKGFRDLGGLGKLEGILKEKEEGKGGS